MAQLEDQLNAILSSPEKMGQIMALANSFTGGEGGEASPPPASPASETGDLGALFGSLDPALLSLAGRLFAEYQRQDDERVRLLQALEPFLRPERQARLEQAMRLTRLSRVIRCLLRSREEGGHV